MLCITGRSLEKVKAPRSPGVVPPGQLPKEKIIKELKEEKNEKCKLYRMLGITCGAFLGIVLI